MRIDRFDLNLLIAFDLLLEERNVTRAAERANVTQSAMSAALGRLRLALNDKLLIPDGRRMVATPHALALAPRVSDAIKNLRSLISGATAFDPATSDRRFEVTASDYICTVLLSPLMAQLKREAPRLGLNVQLPSKEANAFFDDGRIDLQITPEEFLRPNHPSEELFVERHVVVGWSENPVFKAELDEEAYLTCGHIAVRITGVATFVENQLLSGDDRRHIEVIAPSFSMVPWLLPGTNLLALMHERLAQVYAPLLPLEIRQAPIKIPQMREMVQYHTTRASDAGMQWLKDRVHAQAASTPKS